MTTMTAPPLAEFYGVHAGLCMGSVALHGSEEQKAEWLPRLRRWEVIGGLSGRARRRRGR